jgi:hypothetical protein
MEINRELLTGNINLTLDVYGTPEECDHPVRFKVTLTPAHWVSAIRTACSLATMPQADPSSPTPIRGVPPARNAWPAKRSGALHGTGRRGPRIHRSQSIQTKEVTATCPQLTS